MSISSGQGEQPITVTVATARKLSGLGSTTIWALIKAGRLQTVRIGRRRLVIFGSLEKMLAPGREDQ
jgi:hypothetical protein